MTESLRARSEDALVRHYPVSITRNIYVVSDFCSLTSSISPDTSICSFTEVVCVRASHAACIASCNVLHVHRAVCRAVPNSRAILD